MTQLQQSLAKKKNSLTEEPGKGVGGQISAYRESKTKRERDENKRVQMYGRHNVRNQRSRKPY